MDLNLGHFTSPEGKARYIRLFESVLAQCWPVAYEERLVPTRFGESYVIISGPADAPPLVLLHGFSATAAMWGSHIDLLSRHFRCYSIQTITDAGKGQQTAPIATQADYVTWLRELYAGLGLTRARVMGLSYGGFLAASLALHAPELVERLVLLCPAGTLDNLPAQFMLRALPGMLTKSDALLRWYWHWFFHDKARARHPLSDLFVAAWQTFAQSRQFVIPARFSDDDLRRLTMPTTVLIGDHEVIYKQGPQAALERALLIPGVSACLVPNAAHVLTMDNPNDLTRLMLQGLKPTQEVA